MKFKFDEYNSFRNQGIELEIDLKKLKKMDRFDKLQYARDVYDILINLPKNLI